MIFLMQGKVKIIDCIQIRSPNIPMAITDDTRIPNETAARNEVASTAKKNQ